MEDFKNTNKMVVREELYNKLFQKDKLNIVYSEPGRGAGFICKAIINHLAFEEDFQVIEAIDTESANNTLRDLCDDIYALKRLQERTGHKLEKALLFYVDITDVSNPKLIENIQRLYENKIIQSLNIWILFKTVKEFITKCKGNENPINLSIIKVVNNNSYVRIFPSLEYGKVFKGDSKEEIDNYIIDESIEALSNDNIPIHTNIEHCRNIIQDACENAHNIKIEENLYKVYKYLAKVSNKLKNEIIDI